MVPEPGVVRPCRDGTAAALHSPVLSLLVAIVAVRAFGLGKGVLRRRA